ncbi:MAG: hypothetical protein HN348_22030 [Proteobacteria bacterium]|nr:hypothetical protein [Pseudomonadota bacterium]
MKLGKPRILIAGLGETGTALLEKLRLQWDVVGVDLGPGIYEQLTAPEQEGTVTLFTGDASSALVLRRAEADTCRAIVACTGSDEVNVEIVRVAREQFSIPERFVLMYSLDWEERYKQEKVDIVSQDRACASILESRIEFGKKVATEVGLGQGEIVEIQVLENSWVVGRSLRELKPKRWIVGAIYREGKLVVPHGETVFQAEDKVLLIGDPTLLPHITKLIRSGESEFPLRYGTQIVMLCDDYSALIDEEAMYLVLNTSADVLEVMSNGSTKEIDDLHARCQESGIVCSLVCPAPDEQLAQLVFRSDREDVGVLVVAPEKLGFLSKIGLGRSRTAQTIDMLHAPVLIARGTFPYRKVLIALMELPFNHGAAQLAIDLVRMVGASLHLGVANQADLVAGSELREEVSARRQEIENLARMYHVDIKTEVLEGNPIHQMVEASKDYDLLIFPYQRKRKAFLTNPDIALNVIHRAHCSVMVMPVDS